MGRAVAVGEHPGGVVNRLVCCQRSAIRLLVHSDFFRGAAKYFVRTAQNLCIGEADKAPHGFVDKGETALAVFDEDHGRIGVDNVFEQACSLLQASNLAGVACRACGDVLGSAGHRQKGEDCAPGRQLAVACNNGQAKSCCCDCIGRNATCAIEPGGERDRCCRAQCQQQRGRQHAAGKHKKSGQPQDRQHYQGHIFRSSGCHARVRHLHQIRRRRLTRVLRFNRARAPFPWIPIWFECTRPAGIVSSAFRPCFASDRYAKYWKIRFRYTPARWLSPLYGQSHLAMATAARRPVTGSPVGMNS